MKYDLQLNMGAAVRPTNGRRNERAFTLVEMLVSFGVLILILALIAQLFDSATAVTNARSKQMDTDAEVRGVMDRMAIDIGNMVKRTDADYDLNSAAQDTIGNNDQSGNYNNQMAFYTQVPGYYPSTGGPSQSPFSLVGYRINGKSDGPTYNQLERYGYGLLWNGATTTSSNQIIFSTNPTGGTICSSVSKNQIFRNWQAATSPLTVDTNHYELIGPDVFRMAYYYVLKAQMIGGKSYPSILSDTPWDTRFITGNGSINGLKDVAAIGVVFAVVDPKSRNFVSNIGQDIVNLSRKLKPFNSSKNTRPGSLEANWQTEINSEIAGTPQVSPAVLKAVHVYGHVFYLQPN